jgi:hypothetical protein
VVQGFRIAPPDAPSNPVQEVGSVAGFFEGFFDVLVEGAWWRDLELLAPE